MPSPAPPPHTTPTAHRQLASLGEEEAIAAADMEQSARLVGELGWQVAALDRAIDELGKQVQRWEGKRRLAGAGAHVDPQRPGMREGLLHTASTLHTHTHTHTPHPQR